VAEASLDHPDEIVRDVVFMAAGGEQTLRDVVREHHARGRAYKVQVHTVMRRSYAGHYRRMVPVLLEALRFRSNNAVHRPVIRALRLLKAYTESRACRWWAACRSPAPPPVRPAYACRRWAWRRRCAATSRCSR
jgi:hypothetical protein